MCFADVINECDVINDVASGVIYDVAIINDCAAICSTGPPPDRPTGTPTAIKQKL